MHLDFVHFHRLPELSWCATLTKGEQGVRVAHGSGVDCSERFFSEGAWCGEFAQGDFDRLPFFGSGGKIIANGLLICPPSHTLEKIYLCKLTDHLHVSNSLPFLLHVLRDTLDPSFLFYYAAFYTIRYGLHSYKHCIPTLCGNIIRLYYYNNILITNDLNVNQQQRPAAPDFYGFSDYTAFILSHLKALQRNASNSPRKTYYTPLTTISSGYDSVATAVLSRSIGCSEAATFSTARGGQQLADSGVRIAERLSLSVRELDRLEYLKSQDFPEIETNGWASEFASMRDMLPNRLLLTGFHGDTMWDRNCRYVGGDMVRGDASGSDLAELRYKWGFVHVPVPFLAATSLPSIYRISRSSEMHPWTLNTDYDRPIPRRWIEEAGIDRDWFGQKKKAAGINIHEEGLKQVMTATSFVDFNEFAKKNWSFRRSVIGEGVRIYRKFQILNVIVNKKFGNVSFLNWRLSVPLILPHLPSQSRQTLLIHWAMEKLIERYSSAVGSMSADTSEL